MLLLVKDYYIELLKNIPPIIGHDAAALLVDRDRRPECVGS